MNAPTGRTDAVIPFLFEDLPVRGALIQLQDAWARMRATHEYGAVVQETLGQAAAATVLIAQSLKFDGSVTLQIGGGDRLGMLVMQCTHELNLRGMASPAEGPEAASWAELAHAARCSVIVDSGNMEQPYQGIVEIRPESIAASLENYFAKSVQVESRLVLLADDRHCGGILLQHMPDRGVPLEDDWLRLGLLASTLRPDDIAGGVGMDLLHALFNEDDLRVFEAREAAFRCRCSRTRAQEVLRLLGPDETEAVCEEQGEVVVTCEYCGRRQTFDAVDVSRLFAGPSMPAPDTVQ